MEKYDIDLLQRKLDRLMNVYPEIDAVLPDDISAKKLLTGNFKYLAKVYCAFTGYLEGKTVAEKRTIVSAFVSGGFNYNSHKGKIGKWV